MRKLGVAIEYLKDKADSIEFHLHCGESCEYKTDPARAEQYRAAIRVLEAAERVDERDLGRVFMGFVSTELRELLEAIKAALPDGGTDEAV